MNSRFKSIWYHRQARRALQRRQFGFGITCLKKLLGLSPLCAIALMTEASFKIVIPLRLRNYIKDGLKTWHKGLFHSIPPFYRRAKELGINLEPRKEKVVVSLTSYPKRIGTIHKVIDTLLTQTYKPDAIILWLAPEQFPDREADLPKSLLALKEFGLTIDWYHDIRSFKKLIPSLKKYPDACLVTADDDIYYPPDWLEKLVVAHRKYPDCVVCHGAHRIRFEANGALKSYRKWSFGVGNCNPSYDVFVTSGAGALYAPKVLHKDVLREELFLELCPFADDIWFWSMALVNGKKIKVVDQHVKNIHTIEDVDNTEALSRQNLDFGNRNDEQLSNVFKQYPQLLETIRS